MLKFFCALTGDQYTLVSEDTPQSKRKVTLLGSALLLPVIMWAFIGFLMARQVLGASLLVSIITSIACALVIFIVERIIVMAVASQQMKRFRIILGFAVALIGAVALDEVVFKEDIDHQLAENKKTDASKAKEKAGSDFDALYNMKEAEEAIVKAKEDYDNGINDIKMEIIGKGSGHKGVGSIAKLNMRMAEDRKLLWMDAQKKHDSLLQKKAVAENDAFKKEMDSQKDGLIIRLKALFQLVFSEWVVAILYIVFTVLMFCLEFIVVLVKSLTPESNYERRVKLIDEIGARRMQMLQEAGSPLVDPSYCLPNALAARQTLSKKNNSLFN